MNTVKVSPKYQIVIPKEVREALDLRPGQEVAVLRYRGRIELIPMKPVKEMRGFLRGVNPTERFEREKRGGFFRLDRILR